MGARHDLPPVGPPQRELAPRRTMALTTALLALVVVGVVGGIVFFFWVRSSQVARSKAEQQARLERTAVEAARRMAESQAAVDPATTGDRDESAPPNRERVVPDDDGKLLWASPTQGGPISLAYAPLGVQCLVHLRPAHIAAHPEGEKILAALGPWGAAMVEQLQSLAGVKLDEVEALLVTVVATSAGPLDACMRVDLATVWDDAELERRLPGAQWQGTGPQRFLTHQDRALFLAGAGRTLVVCPVALAAELVDSAGEPPLVARDIESLVAASDVDRDATLIVSPKFLASGGVELLPGAAEPLRQVLDELAGQDATALAMSIHWTDDSFFAELRAAPALDNSPRWLATALQQRVGRGGERIEALVAQHDWPDYGLQVVQRFPAMLSALASHTRSGEDERHALLRAYLPAVAGHNLLTGAELLLTQAPDGEGAAGSVAPDGAVAASDVAPLTLEARLARVTTVKFERESLPRALELLGEELGVAVELDTPALREAGITQNQTLSVDLQDRPAGEILLAVLQAANPDPAAAGPADPRQILVYAVDPGVAGGTGRMIVTTRAGAEKAGLTLPAQFTSASE